MHRGIVACQRRRERVDRAAVAQVPQQADRQPLQFAQLLAYREEVEQSLRRVLTGTVTAVDDRDIGYFGRQPRRAFLRVAQDDGVSVAGNHPHRVSQRLAFQVRSRPGVGEADDIAAQPVHSGLEREPRAR